MRKVLSQRKKTTILFATETGRSEGFARNLAKLMSHSFDVKVCYNRLSESLIKRILFLISNMFDEIFQKETLQWTTGKNGSLSFLCPLRDFRSAMIIRKLNQRFNPPVSI